MRPLPRPVTDQIGNTIWINALPAKSESKSEAVEPAYEASFAGSRSAGEISTEKVWHQMTTLGKSARSTPSGIG